MQKKEAKQLIKTAKGVEKAVTKSIDHIKDDVDSLVDEVYKHLEIADDYKDLIREMEAVFGEMGRTAVASFQAAAGEAVATGGVIAGMSAEAINVEKEYIGAFGNIQNSISNVGYRVDELSAKIRRLDHAKIEIDLDIGSIGQIVGGQRISGQPVGGMEKADESENAEKELFQATSGLFKVGSKISSIVGDYEKLSKLFGAKGAAIATGGSLLIDAIVGVRRAIKENNAKLSQENYSKQFGGISLSAEGLEQAAQNIIGIDYTENLPILKESILEGKKHLNDMDKSLQGIQKTDLKLSFGMELTEEEILEYQWNVEQYVSGAQDFINEQMLTVPISTNFLIGEGEQADQINAGNMQFLIGLESELQAESEKVTEILREAVKDGFDIEKIDISGPLDQIAEIRNAFTDAETETNLQMLELQFSGRELNEETYQDLMSTMAEYQAEIKVSAEEALRESLNMANARLKLEDGYGDAEYEADVAQYKQGYYDMQADGIYNSFEFMQNTILDMYGDDISPTLDAIKGEIDASMAAIEMGESTAFSLGYDIEEIVQRALGVNELDDVQKGAIDLITAGLDPIAAEMSQVVSGMYSNGVEVDKKYITMMEDAKGYRAVSGDRDAVSYMVGSGIGESEVGSTMAEIGVRDGGMYDDGLIEGVRAKHPEVLQTVNELFNDFEALEKEGRDVDIPLNLNYYIVENYINDGVGAYVDKNEGNTNNPPPKKGMMERLKEKLPFLADGGIFHEPLLAVFAEAGPEAAIPIDGSSNAINLWKETGRLLGVLPNNESGPLGFNASQIPVTAGKARVESSNGQEVKIEYNPTYQFYGDAPGKETLTESARVSQEEFAKMMHQYLRNNERVSFA